MPTLKRECRDISHTKHVVKKNSVKKFSQHVVKNFRQRNEVAAKKQNKENSGKHCAIECISQNVATKVNTAKVIDIFHRHSSLRAASLIFLMFW